MGVTDSHISGSDGFRHPPEPASSDDKPTIGLLLCRSKNSVVAQYSVNGINKPIGIAEFDLLGDLPVPLAANLPSIAQLEAEFSSDLLDDPEIP